MTKDYYAILSVSQQATRQQIKQRFLELARSRHPDLHEGEEKLKAESEFQDITEAFNVLSNPARRRQHDVELSSPAPANVAADPKTTVRTFMTRAARARTVKAGIVRRPKTSSAPPRSIPRTLKPGTIWRWPAAASSA